jgi:Carboxypeptidase regulatory-like domain
MLLALILLAAAADAATTLAPAPGVPPAAGVELSTPGFRFYRIDDRAFYYPADYTLVTWPLPGLDRTDEAEIVTKDHASDSWEKSLTFAAPVEKTDAARRVRFALAPGSWDLAILAPGFAPAFLANVRPEGETRTLPPAKLARAARLKARILAARSGKTPEKWSAHVRHVGGAGGEGEETRFFATRPIASGGAALDFSSLPPGVWELDVVVPGTGRRGTLVSAPKPGSVADLGDFYVSQAGRLRVTLAFPTEVPAQTFVVRVARQALDPDQQEIPVEKKTVAPQAETHVDFENIEPGLVVVRGESASGEIERTERTEVRSSETAEVRLTFVPVTLHGRVRRGDVGVPDATIRAAVGMMGKNPTATSDELGDYSLRFWAAGNDVFLTTTVSGSDLPFDETVPLEPGAMEVEHDVLLPAGEIRGVVRDAETGAPIRGASVHFSNTVPRETKNRAVRFKSGVDTDADGRFSLTNLSGDPIDVEVKSDGYSPAKFPNVVPTPDAAELDIRMEKGVRLVGTVTDPAGSPAAGATVGIDPDAEGYFFTQTTSTTAAGEFEFRNMGPGPHLLGILQCGFTLVLRAVYFDPPAAGTPEPRVDVSLSPELAPITVHIEDETGRPYVGESVWLSVNGLVLPLSDFSRAAGRCGQTPTTDADGNMTLRGLPRGRLSSLDFDTHRPVSSFANDGTQSVWTIRTPRGNNPRDATASPAR